MALPEYSTVLEFWFQELQPKDWFKGGESVDQAIRQRFESLIDAVYDGSAGFPLEQPTGRLAALLVLDQFPRNIYRNTARSFAYDDKALELSLEGIDKGLDRLLQPVERVFFYLPLEHSETLAMQDLSLERFSRLVVDSPDEFKSEARRYLDYAWRHYEIIKRFDRYPHRNDILSRAATPAEVKFLTQPGSSFL